MTSLTVPKRGVNRHLNGAGCLGPDTVSDPFVMEPESHLRNNSIMIVLIVGNDLLAILVNRLVNRKSPQQGCDSSIRRAQSEKPARADAARIGLVEKKMKGRNATHRRPKPKAPVDVGCGAECAPMNRSGSNTPGFGYTLSSYIMAL